MRKAVSGSGFQVPIKFGWVAHLLAETQAFFEPRAKVLLSQRLLESLGNLTLLYQARARTPNYNPPQLLSTLAPLQTLNPEPRPSSLNPLES